MDHITHVESVPRNTAVAELGEERTIVEPAKSALPPVPSEVFCRSSPSEAFPLEGTTKADHIMDHIAVFLATAPRPSLVCDGTLRPTHPSLDHNHGSLAVANFAPGSYPALKENYNK